MVIESRTLPQVKGNKIVFHIYKKPSVCKWANIVWKSILSNFPEFDWQWWDPKPATVNNPTNFHQSELCFYQAQSWISHWVALSDIYS